MTAFDVFTIIVIAIGFLATLLGVLLFTYLVLIDQIDRWGRRQARGDTAGRRATYDERRSQAMLRPRSGMVDASGRPEFFRPQHARNRRV